MVSQVLYRSIKISLIFVIVTDSGSSLFDVLFGGEYPVWAALSGAACCAVALVDCTPWRCVHMCPFWVSSDSGENLFMFFMLTRGDVR